MQKKLHAVHIHTPTNSNENTLFVSLRHGTVKFQVSFAEYVFFHRALLQKRPIILRSLQIVATS